MSQSQHSHLRRLERLWVEHPIYFVTTCTQKRKALLAFDAVAGILVEEWKSARQRHGWAVGRYVIMPDHVHFFCTPDREAKSLSQFMGSWKEWTSKRIKAALLQEVVAERGDLACNNGLPPSPRAATRTSRATRGERGSACYIWQREFFDHLLRSSESYSEKWEYVRQNPFRAGLANTAEDWLYQGEIEILGL